MIKIRISQIVSLCFHLFSVYLMFKNYFHIFCLILVKNDSNISFNWLLSLPLSISLNISHATSHGIYHRPNSLSNNQHLHSINPVEELFQHAFVLTCVPATERWSVQPTRLDRRCASRLRFGRQAPRRRPSSGRGGCQSRTGRRRGSRRCLRQGGSAKGK